MIHKLARALPGLMLVCLSLSGCQSFYLANRGADFGDIFQLGGGLTTENPVTGVIPPALGVHVQATEYLNLGALHFTGKSAEIDGRGTFAGFESRTRFGLGPYQLVRLEQDYVNGAENYFKRIETQWSDRMTSPNYTWRDRPSKKLAYDHFAVAMQEGIPIMPRGYQYWGLFAAEIALCDPLITHFGFDMRLGIDVSEISDFLLGWFAVDFKRDDLTVEEHQEFRGN